MMLSSYTKALKRYDKDLFAGLTKDGRACVFRKTKRFEPVCVDDGFKLLNLIDDVQFIFALTDNWLMSGKPRDWGIDHVLGRIREIDTLAKQRFFEELDEHNEQVEEKKKRHFRNEAEAFFADNRKAFAKAFDETHGTITSLSKDEPRKRLKDRSIHNGNRE